MQSVSDAETKFVFKYPSYMIDPESAAGKLNYDSDDDLDVDRNAEGVLVIGTLYVRRLALPRCVLNMLCIRICIQRIVSRRAQLIHGAAFGRFASLEGCPAAGRLHPVALGSVQGPDDTGAGIRSRPDQHRSQLPGQRSHLHG